MMVLRWFAGFILLFFIISLIFKIGGALINMLILIASIIFIVDAIIGRKKTT